MKKPNSIVSIVLSFAIFSTFAPRLFAGDLMKKESSEYLREAIKEQKNGNIDFSISLYQKATYTDNENATALNNLGTAFAQKGLYIKAEEYYKRAIEVDPYYSVALMNLALLYAQRKEYDKFFKYWKRAQGLDIYSPFLIDDEED